MNNRIEKLISEYRLEIYFTKRHLDYFVLVIAFILALALDWGTAEIAVLLAAIYLILNPIRSQLFATGALLFLLLTPIALVLGKDARADKLAIIAYSLLTLAVVISIWETRRVAKKIK